MTSVPVIWLCSESVEVLSGSVGLLELSFMGLKSLKPQDLRRGGFLRPTPLFPKRASIFGSGLSQDDLILMDMVTLAAFLEASYDSASQTCTRIAVTGGLLKQFPGLAP